VVSPGKDLTPRPRIVVHVFCFIENKWSVLGLLYVMNRRVFARVLIIAAFIGSLTFLVKESVFGAGNLIKLAAPRKNHSSKGFRDRVPVPQMRIGKKCFRDPVPIQHETRKMTAIELRDAIERECAEMTAEDIEECDVPNVVHFVIDSVSEMMFHHYLSIRTAYNVLKPDRIFLHVFGTDEIKFEDGSPSFGRLLNDVPTIEVILARDPTFVHDRPVQKMQHKSDMIRMESIIRFGGVYFDLDVYVFRKMDPLYKYETTLTEEHSLCEGLNNGLIFAKRCARFMRRWYDGYKTFDDSHYFNHSVLMSYKMWKEDPSYLHVDNFYLRSDNPTSNKNMFTQNLNLDWWLTVGAVHSFIYYINPKPTDEYLEKNNDVFSLMARRALAGKPGLYDEDDFSSLSSPREKYE
jgi:hypothetical protein